MAPIGGRGVLAQSRAKKKPPGSRGEVDVAGLGTAQCKICGRPGVFYPGRLEHPGVLY